MVIAKLFALHANAVIVKGLIYTIQNLIRRSQLDTGHLECITNQLMSDLLWLQGVAARSPSLMRCPGYGGDFGGCGKFSWQRVLLLALSRLWGVDPKSSARCARASPSWIYPAGKLQWHFTCGLDFGHSLWLPFKAVFVVVKGLLIVPVGTMGLCWRGDSLFQMAGGGGGGGLWTVSLWACAPLLSRFILLWHFSCFCSPGGVIKSSCGNYGSLLAWG